MNIFHGFRIKENIGKYETDAKHGRLQQRQIQAIQLRPTTADQAGRVPIGGGGGGGELVEQVKSSPPTSGTREKKVRTALSIDPSRCHPNDPQLAPPRKVLNQFGIADTVAIPTDADQIRSEPREAPTAMYQLAANKHSSYFIEKRTECLGRKKKLSSIPLYKLYCKSARTSG